MIARPPLFVITILPYSTGPEFIIRDFLNKKQCYCYKLVENLFKGKIEDNSFYNYNWGYKSVSSVFFNIGETIGSLVSFHSSTNFKLAFEFTKTLIDVSDCRYYGESL